MNVGKEQVDSEFGRSEAGRGTEDARAAIQRHGLTPVNPITRLSPWLFPCFACPKEPALIAHCVFLLAG